MNDSTKPITTAILPGLLTTAAVARLLQCCDWLGVIPPEDLLDADGAPALSLIDWTYRCR